MTSEIKDSANRWMAFQCPSCFGLFRLQRFNLGKKGQCPVCRSLIALPGIEENEPESHAPAESLLAKVAVATPITDEEREAQEAAQRARRRVYVGAASEQLDWEEDSSQHSVKRISGFFLGSIAMIVVLAAALGIYYVQTLPKGKATGSTAIAGDEASNLALEKAIQIKNTDTPAEQAIVDSVDQYAKFDLQEIEGVVKGFLASESVEERMKWIRDPERVKPMMLHFYEGEAIEAEGFESLNRTEISYRGRYLTTMVRTEDFLSYPIAVVRIGDGDEARYLVDWESWSGYCELTPEEAREKKPTEPFLMRVLIRAENYYNYGFSDDKLWSCHRLNFRNSDDSFLAYAARDTAADKAFKELRKSGGSSPYVIKVRYPEGARASDQVEIVEVVSVGWISESKSEE